MTFWEETMIEAENRAACGDLCQCATCGNEDCPVPCKANMPCDFKVTECKDHKKES